MSGPSTIQKVVDKKKLVIGTSSGYFPFEMKDKEGKFVGYDMDLGKAIADALKVEVELKDDLHVFSLFFQLFFAQTIQILSIEQDLSLCRFNQAQDSPASR